MALVPRYLKEVKDHASKLLMAIEELELVRIIAKAALYLPNNIDIMIEIRDFVSTLRDQPTKDEDPLLIN